MKTRSLPDNIEKAILPVLLRHDVCHASVFGSFARGTQIETSDVDILVEFRGEKSLFDLVGLRLELERVLGRRVDVVSTRALNPLMKQRVLEEQVVLL